MTRAVGDTKSIALQINPGFRDPSCVGEPLSSVHIGALDGIRGIAILMVLAFHFGVAAKFLGFHGPFLRACDFGWAGVDLFFVLSGFLITGILYDSRNSERFFGNFYARRALRIFPIYYLGLLLAICLTTFWPPLWKTATGGAIWPAFYLANIAVAANGWLAIPEILSHYWSLSVEEHFYLFWPLVVWYGTRRRIMAVAVAVAVGAFLLRTLLLLNGTDSTAIFVLTPTRADTLAVGAFCSLLIRGPLGVHGALFPAAAVLAGSTFGLLAVVLNRWSLSEYDPAMQTFGYTFIAISCGAGIVTTLAWRPLEWALSCSVLRWLGRYSYGMYVWHYFVYFIFFEIPDLKNAFGITGKMGAILYLATAIVIVIAVAYISFHVVEKPFLRLKNYFYSSRIPAPPPLHS